MSRRAAIGLALIIGGSASSGLAQSVEDAREQYLAADFRAAAATFEAVLAAPDVSREDALEAHRYLAALQEMLGDHEAAARHAAAAAALDPDVSPPDGSPEEVAGLLAEARDTLGGPAEVRIEADGLTAGIEGTVRAVADRAPAALVARLRLRCGDADTEGDAPEVSLQVTPPDGVDRLGCDVAGLTPGGAALLSASREIPISGSGTETGGGGGRPVWPWIAAGAGAAAVAAVVVAVVLTSGADKASFRDVRVEGW